MPRGGSLSSFHNRSYYSNEVFSKAIGLTGGHQQQQCQEPGLKACGYSWQLYSPLGFGPPEVISFASMSIPSHLSEEIQQKDFHLLL